MEKSYGVYIAIFFIFVCTCFMTGFMYVYPEEATCQSVELPFTKFKTGSAERSGSSGSTQGLEACSLISFFVIIGFTMFLWFRRQTVTPLLYITYIILSFIVFAASLVCVVYCQIKFKTHMYVTTLCQNSTSPESVPHDDQFDWSEFDAKCSNKTPPPRTKVPFNNRVFKQLCDYNGPSLHPVCEAVPSKNGYRCASNVIDVDAKRYYDLYPFVFIGIAAGLYLIIFIVLCVFSKRYIN